MSFHIFKLLMPPLVWLFFITITFSSIPIGAKQSILCQESERQALLTFKSGLRDEGGRLSSWSDADDNSNCCNWTGVSCSNHTGHVVKLDLSYSSFSGIVPPHLGNLSSLQYLDLGGNSLEVESLQWLKGLSSLKHLNLDNVNLEKAGYDWLKAFNMLPSLMELHLFGCGLSSLPPLINQSINLTSLSTLDLSLNNFSSSLTMPPWLFNLTNLINLRCLGSSLQTVIPNDIGKLVKLQQLDLSLNNIRGQLPASLGNLSNLVMLNLGMLNLDHTYGIEGRIPATFRHLCKLRELRLGRNKLQGELNEFIDGFARSCSNNQLESLDLSVNSLWGSIPTTIGSLTSLKTLLLSHNQMNGTIAGSIGKLSELEKLDLSYNQWQGMLTETHFEKHAKLQSFDVTTTIPKLESLVMNVTQDWLPPFRTSLKYLELDGVKMWSREFPRWTQTLRQLDTLSLRDCDLSDSIPTEFWESCPNITYLYLSNNAINIRTSFKNWERLLPLVPAAKLEWLDLANGGDGGGEIPSNIGQLAPSLDYLDLSSNSISGEIPRSIGQLSKLFFLFLNNNSLTGELTHHQWQKMVSLRQLDLSNNSLVGKIPESLASSTLLAMLLLSYNNLQGQIPTFINSSQLEVLDFGGNKLTGNIPPSLLTKTMILLRLRDNMLNGTIPSEICLLSHLQTLDLAHNILQGIIPKCLGNLSKSDGYSVYPKGGIALVTKGREYTYDNGILRLVHLVDLSGNNLSGNIPGSLMNLTAMHTLNLSMNHLTGQIPSNIGLLKKLESLDLSQNRLSGPIPLSLSALSFLSALNLSQNNLSGKIPLVGTQLQTLHDSSRYEGNPLLCGPPLLTICPGNEPTKENGGQNEKHGKSGFDLEEWGFILSLVLGFFVGFWGVCGSLVLKASWRQAYFGYLAGFKDKIIVTVVVNAARLQRKMGVIRMTT